MPYHGIVKKVKDIPLEEVIRQYNRPIDMILHSIVPKKFFNRRCVHNTCRRFRGYVGDPEEGRFVTVRCMNGPRKDCRKQSLLHEAKYKP
jgi:hypothetical protein